MGIDENKYIQSLIDIKTVLDSVRITYWIEYGTLLAAYRDKHPLEWDLDDIDIGIRFEDFNEEINIKINDKMTALGYEVVAPKVNRYSYQRCYKKDNRHIDIWIFHKIGDFYHKTWFLRPGCYEQLVMPAKYYDNLTSKILYCNINFLIPNDIENYLTLMYGINWRNPLPTHQYNDKHVSHKDMIYSRFIDWLNNKYDEKKYLTEDY